MNKARIVTLSDGLLFTGFYPTIEEAWRASVPITISEYLKNPDSDISSVLEPYRSGIREAAMPDATKYQTRLADSLVQELSHQVLIHREHEKTNSNSPLGILERSYSILKDSGFADNAIRKMSHEIGNFEYLNQYNVASQKNMKVSDFAKNLISSMANSPDDLELLRAENKRTKYPYKGQEIILMQNETDKLQGLSDEVNVSQHGMVTNGSKYTGDLELLAKGQGNNIIVIPDEYLVQRLKSTNHKEISHPVAKSIKDKNLLIVNVHERKQGRWAKEGEKHWQDAVRIDGQKVPVVNIYKDKIASYIESGAYNSVDALYSSQNPAQNANVGR